MDLSDGVSIDLPRLCEASNVFADIDRLPLFPGATPEQALHGGEDYELLFTVRRNTKVPASFEDIPLTRIGTMLKGSLKKSTSRVTLDGQPLPALGHDHFRS
jgi:thiamine-monophosphate kinase